MFGTCAARPGGWWLGGPLLAATLLAGCGDINVAGPQPTAQSTPTLRPDQRVTSTHSLKAAPRRPVEVLAEFGESMPEVFTGAEVTPDGKVVIYRKPDAAFDAGIRERDTTGVAELRDAPRSLAELERTRAAAKTFAQDNDITVVGSRTPHNGGPAVLLVPAGEVERARRALGERFGGEVQVVEEEEFHPLVLPAPTS